MKKTLTIIISLIALLAVSCNLDSTTGIYDSLQDAKPQDENAISNLVGTWTEEGKTHYVFNTTKGVAIDSHLNVKFSGVDAKAVDASGNILVHSQEGFKIWMKATEKFEEFSFKDDEEAKNVTVYQTRRFHDRAYDFILRNGDEFTLWFTDDLQALTGEGKTEWTKKEIGALESTGEKQVYPTLVGHGAWILRGKNGYSVPKEERVVYLADGSTFSYLRNEDLLSSVPTYILTKNGEHYYVFDGKLYRDNNEVKTEIEEGQKDGKSLGAYNFFITVDPMTSTITGVPTNYENNLKVFRYTPGDGTLKFIETDINKKEVLGIFPTGIADEFNIVLTGEYDKTVAVPAKN